MSRADTWMPLYVGDYLADTMHLSAEEHGAYLLLLMHSWRTGALPDDDKTLAAIARVSLKVWRAGLGGTIRAFFSPSERGLVQLRLERERERAGANTQKRRAAGAAGAAAKWSGKDEGDARRTRAERLAQARAKGRHTPAQWAAMVDFCGNRCVRCGDTNGPIVRDHITPIYQGGSDGIENLQPLCISCNAAKGPEAIDHRPDGWQHLQEMPGERLANARQTPGPSPSPSPSPSRDISLRSISPRAPHGTPSAFDAWWAEYPRKVGKDVAAKAYAAAVKRGASDGDLLVALRRQAWPADPQFIPHPSTWLNQGRWQDDPEAAAPAPVPAQKPSSLDWMETDPLFARTR
jgi:uncharacterized protein YdaU (DUF1376 family)